MPPPAGTAWSDGGRGGDAGPPAGRAWTRPGAGTAGSRDAHARGPTPRIRCVEPISINSGRSAGRWPRSSRARARGRCRPGRVRGRGLPPAAARRTRAYCEPHHSCGYPRPPPRRWDDEARWRRTVEAPVTGRARRLAALPELVVVQVLFGCNNAPPGRQDPRPVLRWICAELRRQQGPPSPRSWHRPTPSATARSPR